MSSIARKFRALVNPAATFVHTFSSKLEAFRTDQRGTIAMMFGLTAVAMVMFVGAAVDMGRWLHAHSQTKAAVDSAVLAGARSLQVQTGDTAAALQIARTYYRSNVASRPQVKNDSIDFIVNDAGTAMTAKGTAYIDTPFLAVANIRRLALWKESAVNYSKATSEIGGGNGGEIEISIMLDTTGSMSGQKLADLKLAAKDLIDIVLPEGTQNVRVALAPFAETVRPGSYLARVRGSRASSVRLRDSSGRLQTYSLTSCVSERSGAQAYTDAAPDGGDVVGAVYTKSGSCTPGAATIVPLTSNKARLTSMIDSLTASGGTAGHLGSAWAWYLLSPRWSGVWTGESTPAAYEDGNVKKIAILMTDGEYNTQYDAAGLMTSTRGGAPVNGPSSTQARTLCGGMKEQGIEVYTVGFDLDNSAAIDTLEECASNAGTSYLAQDGAQLRNVFRDIAIKLSPLHLTN